MQIMAPPAEPNSQELLIKQLPRYKSRDIQDRDDLNMRSGLMAAPWVEEFLQVVHGHTSLGCDPPLLVGWLQQSLDSDMSAVMLQAPENEKVLTCGALLSDATELPQDHMVRCVCMLVQY